MRRDEIERISGMSDEEAGMLRLEMLAEKRNDAQVALAAVLYHDELAAAVAACSPRSMPKSEARKRLEERQAHTCLSCGRTGPDVRKTDLSAGPVCSRDTEACTQRRQEAKACLEPVPA